MSISKSIRIAITKNVKLYNLLSGIWRKINVGYVARIQYHSLFKKFDQQRKKLGHEPMWKNIEIETFNRCNGKCSFCPVNYKIDPRVPTKMTEDLFRKIIGELEELNYSGTLALYSNNEPFLDNRILDFMKYAREHCKKAYLFVYTNGTLLTLEKFKESMKYLDEIHIDNYSDDGYWHENIMQIRDYCLKHPDIASKATISMRKQTEVLTTRGGTAPNREGTMKKETLPCYLPFKQIIIRPDGKLSLCCNDPLGQMTMGDVSVNSLYDIWNSDGYKKLREKIRTNRSLIKKCEYCDTVYTTD